MIKHSADYIEAQCYEELFKSKSLALYFQRNGKRIFNFKETANGNQLLFKEAPYDVLLTVCGVGTAENAEADADPNNTSQENTCSLIAETCKASFSFPS